MDAPLIDTNWQTILFAYGPLGVMAVFVGIYFLTKWIKGDPVMKLAETCSAQVAVSNEVIKQNRDSLERMTSIMEVANQGRDHLANLLNQHGEDIKTLTKSFDQWAVRAPRANGRR